MAAEIAIIYDGDCPFCRSYVRLVELRDAGLEVQLLNARGPEVRDRYPEATDFNLDDGMLVRWKEQWFHGADAMHLLSQLSTTAPGRTVFLNRWWAGFLYPVLRSGRALTLRALGRRRIDDPQSRS